MDVQTDGPAVCRAYRAISGIREGSGRLGAFFPGGVCSWARWAEAPAPPRLAEQSGVFSGVPSISHRFHQRPVERRMSKRNAQDYVRRLIALSKKSGGLRPIVIGYTYRRLAAKCANRYALGRLDSFFAPLQVGVAVPGGAEAAIHASRSFLTIMTEDEIFVKLDFANAFKTLRRDIMLQMVYDTKSEIYEFTHQAYSADSQLQFCPFVVRSQMGPQQGDPLGPLLFCLPLQPLLRSMRSGFRIGYLGNLSLGGKKDDVRQDIALIENLESSLGLVLNRHKCELYSKKESTETEFEGFEQMDTGSLLLLGAPLFKGTALDEALMKHRETLERAVTDMACLRTQAALILLRASFGAAKLTFLLRTAPCYALPGSGEW